jgi:ABC-type multidrug transport system fused ATPase/permease subunit
VVLEAGRILDVGTWDELMNRCPTFCELAGEASNKT